jgi:tight adherence protein C
MRLLASLLFGAAAALVTVQAGRLSTIRIRIPRGPITGRRRRALLGSTGIVFGTDEALRRLVNRRVLLVALASMIGVLAVWARPDAGGVLAAFGTLAVAWQLPTWQARQHESNRLRRIEVEIVDALGEMVMGVEAGLTLEAVMNIYANRHHSPLAEEFRAVLDRIALGVSRDESLKVMLDRTPTSGMQLFVAAVRQNQRIGAPLATVLRQQAATARRRRRQAIEERSAKLAMKMVFPTVFCVLPALMIVVVGPALIRTLQSLT